MQSKLKRPFGIKLLTASFLWIGCLGTLTFPFIGFGSAGTEMVHLLTAFFDHSAPWIRNTVEFLAYPLIVFWWLCYIAYAVIGFGLLKLKEWARKAVVGVCVLGIALGVLFALITMIYGGLIFGLCMFLIASVPGFWQIWYLCRPRVRFAFSSWVPPEGDPEAFPPALSLTGKLCVASMLVGSCLLVVVPVVSFIENLFADSPVYKLAMTSAGSSPCVTNVTGKPMQAGWFTNGNLQEEDQSGSANLTIPLHGPKGKGDLHLLAKKKDGIWQITSLDFAHEEKVSHLIPAGSTPACQ